jgi:hypothetical protein
VSIRSAKTEVRPRILYALGSTQYLCYRHRDRDSRAVAGGAFYAEAACQRLGSADHVAEAHMAGRHVRGVEAPAVVVDVHHYAAILNAQCHLNFGGMSVLCRGVQGFLCVIQSPDTCRNIGLYTSTNPTPTF